MEGTEDASPQWDCIGATSTRFDKGTDACFAWLLHSYAPSWRHAILRGEPSTDAEIESDKHLRRSLQDGVAMCHASRWSRFSFPSDPQRALPSTYASHHLMMPAVQATEGRAPTSTMAAPQPIILADEGGTAHGVDIDALTAEPSRHCFTYARQHTQASSRHDGEAHVPRPWYGGYVSVERNLRGADACRFLIFPQHHHAPLLKRSTAQEVPSFCQGTLRFLYEHLNPSSSSVKGREEGRQRHGGLAQAFTFAINIAHKFPRPDACGGAGSWMSMFPLDDSSIDLFFNATKIDRRYNADRKIVERHSRREDGISWTLRYRHPYYSTNLRLALLSPCGTSSSTAALDASTSSLQACGGTPHTPWLHGRILALSISDIYTFTGHLANLSRLWRRWMRMEDAVVRCGWECAATPGLDVSWIDRCATIFAKLSSEGWIQLPLPTNVDVLLRHQAAWVAPVELDVLSPRFRRHRHFWATQGPSWRPSLLRGMENDYEHLHLAERWFALCSVELHRGSRGGGLLPSGLVPFINLCFSDGLSTPPRTTVGLAQSAATPRTTRDAFNRITPFHFECSFSWWLDATHPTSLLHSGIKPDVAADKQYLRTSPVEVMRHFRCGLTWKFDDG